jgi:hypothetical protein
LDPEHHFISSANTNSHAVADGDTYADGVTNTYTNSATTDPVTDANSSAIAVPDSERDPDSNAFPHANTHASSYGDAHPSSGRGRRSANHHSGAGINSPLRQRELQMERRQSDEILAICWDLARGFGYL